MDILLISGVPPFPPHSIERGIVYYLSRELVERHHQLDLICFYEQPEDFADVPRYERFFKSVQLFQRPALTQKDLKDRLRNHFPTSAEAGWSPPLWGAIQDLIHEKRYDLIQLIGGVELYEIGALMKDIANLFIVPEVQSFKLKSQIALEPRWRHPLKKQLSLANEYESWMFDRFDTVGVVSEQERLHLKERLGDKVLRLPFGVDLDYFVPTGREPRIPGLLFIGNYSYPMLKDAAITLCKTIFPAVQKVVPNVNLYIVGRNVPNELQAYASENIVITGHVPDLRPYFELATAYVSPIQHAAGLRQDILKALAMMTPVIATPISCDGLNLVDKKEVLLAQTTDEFIRQTLEVLNDETLRFQLRQNGRKKMLDEYNWGQAAEKFEVIYQNRVRNFR